MQRPSWRTRTISPDDADALADEEVEQLLLDARDPREPLARDRQRAAQARLEQRVPHRELGDPAVIERDRAIDGAVV